MYLLCSCRVLSHPLCMQEKMSEISATVNCLHSPSKCRDIMQAISISYLVEHKREVSNSVDRFWLLFPLAHTHSTGDGHRVCVVQHRRRLGIWVMPARVTRRSEAWRRVAPDTSARAAIWGSFPLSPDWLAAMYNTKPVSDSPCLEVKRSDPVMVPVPPCNPTALPENTFSVVECIIFIQSVSIFNSWHAKCAICLCNNAFLFNHVLPLLFFCQPLAMFHCSSNWRNRLLK